MYVFPFSPLIYFYLFFLARQSARSQAAAAAPLMFWYAVRMRLTLELLHWAD